MGTDYGDFLREAQRVVKTGGWLWIAEVRKGWGKRQRAGVGRSHGETERIYFSRGGNLREGSQQWERERGGRDKEEVRGV
jgi:ubiquinone/menaquinone biosynthesis C-methylase UbiE